MNARLQIVLFLVTTAIFGFDPQISRGQTEPTAGEIRMVAFNFAPRFWTKCDGQELSVFNYKALFAIVGTGFGGDGETRFAVPDLRGRVPLHIGKGAGGVEFKLGSKGGVESLPYGGEVSVFTSRLVPQQARVKVDSSTRRARSIMQPFLGLNYVIGVYGDPSRGMEGILGEIRILAGSKIPKGWQACDGQVIDAADNPDLFKMLGGTFGGDGKSNFKLPDLRGRVAIMAGKGSKLADRKLGESGGSPETTVDLAKVASGGLDSSFASKPTPGKDDELAQKTVNMQPYLGLNFVIRTNKSDDQRFATEGYTGEVRMFSGKTAPKGWAFCDGSLIRPSDNSALYSLLGIFYGGNGRTTFALPDMRGRVAIHAGTGPGLNAKKLGDRWGNESWYATRSIEAAIPEWQKWPTRLVLEEASVKQGARPRIYDFALTDKKQNDAPVYRAEYFYMSNEANTAYLFRSEKASNTWTIRLGTPDDPGKEFVTGKMTDKDKPWELDWGVWKLAVTDTVIVKEHQDKQPSNMQPYTAVNFIICTEGLYPSRS